MSNRKIKKQLPRVQLLTTELVDQVREVSVTLFDQHAAGEYLSKLIGRKDREHFVVLHLDQRLRVSAVETVAIGTLGSAPVHPREVFKGAILGNARGIICGHNHPSGDLTPSKEDLFVCQKLHDAGELLSVPVLDFLIVTVDGFKSLDPTSTNEAGNVVTD